MNVVAKSMLRSVASHAVVVLGIVGIASATACTVGTQGSDDVPVPSLAPSGGTVTTLDAELFAWNSCYSKTDDLLIGGGCLEQWGSYPAECSNAFLTWGHARGQRCKDVCNVGTCSYGCFNSYDFGESSDFAASYYQCTNNPPDFTVSLSSTTLTATAGVKGGSDVEGTITTAPTSGSYTESIVLAVSGLSTDGITATIGTAGTGVEGRTVNAGDSASLTITVDDYVATGTYSFEVTGTGSVNGTSSVKGTLIVK